MSTTPSDICYGYAFDDLTRSTITDDAWMLSAARLEARSKFDNNRSLPIENKDTQQKIKEAEDVARILRQNVVQGREVEGTGNGGKRYRTYDLDNMTLGGQGYNDRWMELEVWNTAKSVVMCRTSDS